MLDSCIWPGAKDRVEAEMIQGLLESAGIPSVLQHMGVDGSLVGIGVLNPAGAPRRVMVRAEESERARTLIAETLVEGGEVDLTELAEAPPEESGQREPRGYGLVDGYARIWAWSLGVIGLAFAVFLLLR